MKVLLINSVCGVLGTGRICTDIAAELEKQGHTCKIAYGRKTVPEQYQKYAVRIGSPLNVALDGIKSRLLDNAGFNSYFATKRFLKWVRQYDPDVIHLHNLHGYYINIKLLFEYLRDAGKPVVWTFHDCWPFTGHCAYFDFAGCDQWEQDACRKCARKKAYPCSWGLSRAAKNYAEKKRLFTMPKSMTVVTPSHWLAQRVERSFLGKYPVKVIHNGIDTEIFQPRSSDFRQNNNLSDKKLVLAVAAVWSNRKGLDDVLALAGRLDETYRVVVVGVTQEQQKKLPDGIIGITRTNDPVVLAEIYAASDVFINTTYEDNFPTVNLEAQACGTPVITYRTGGSPESVPPENVVPVGDMDALLEAVKRVTGDAAAAVKPITADEIGLAYLEEYHNAIGTYDTVIKSV